MSFDLAPGPHVRPPAPNDNAAHPAPPKPAAAPPPPSATAPPTATATATATAAPTAAASPTASASPDARATSFQAVENEPETHNGESLMVSAYSGLWLILMGWLVLVWRKQAGLSARLEGLEQAIDRAVAKAGAGKTGARGDGAEKAREA